MVFKDAYSIAQDMLREAGYRALSVGEMERLGERSPHVPPRHAKGTRENQSAVFTMFQFHLEGSSASLYSRTLAAFFIWDPLSLVMVWGFPQ